MSGTKPNRKRPVLHTTIGNNTLAILNQVAKDIARPNYGVTIDYIVNDWVSLKKSLLHAAAPAEAEAVTA